MNKDFIMIFLVELMPLDDNTAHNHTLFGIKDDDSFFMVLE